MSNDLKNRREFLGKIRDWLVGGLYAMIPLSLLGRGGAKHLLEIDTEKGTRPLKAATTCNCSENSSTRVIALHQADLDKDHHGCGCAKSNTKASAYRDTLPGAGYQCSCTGQWERHSAHEVANDN